MEYTTLGDTGMTVSKLCLGCMSFGDPDWREWVLDEDEGKAIVERALELGINFFDTANMYSNGESERVLGEALAGHREESVVATKAYFQMDESDPNSGGLSRKAIEQALERSLDRLGMETIDLYQIHRWDDETPIGETLAALDDAVRRGSVRHIGASSMWAHQFANALHTSDRLGLDRFATMQNHYNLAYREEEREMLPLCQRENVGVIPWSPLARGYLTRPDEAVEEMRDAFAERREFLMGLLEDHGVEVPEPQGAFYMMPKVGGDDTEWCDKAISEAQVATVPGSAFGSPGYARISYANSKDRLQEAVDRLAEADLI